MGCVQSGGGALLRAVQARELQKRARAGQGRATGQAGNSLETQWMRCGMWWLTVSTHYLTAWWCHHGKEHATMPGPAAHASGGAAGMGGRQPPEASRQASRMRTAL